MVQKKWLNAAIDTETGVAAVGVVNFSAWTVQLVESSDANDILGFSIRNGDKDGEAVGREHCDRFVGEHAGHS